MKFEALAETCELENKQTPSVDTNAEMLNNIAEKVEQVINSKLEEFNKTVNPVETPSINNNGDNNAANNDNAGNSTGNNESANGGAEEE